MTTITYAVTFGQRYHQETHPASALIHPDGWLEIDAASEDDARDLAAEALGMAWSSLYRLEDVGAEYYPSGVLGVIFRCVLCNKVVINDRLICPACLPGLAGGDPR